MSIYFDHSATTPVDEKVLTAMLPYFSEKFGNATSLHGYGQVGAKAVDDARQQVSDFLHCQPKEVIFTSGATESNNLVINGLLRALTDKGIVKPHIITTIIEHPAILEPCKELVRKGLAEINYLQVDSKGLVKVEDVEKLIKDNTVLISIMYANNEIGSIQPIIEIGKLVKKINERKLNEWEKGKAERGEKPQPIYFHTDATQAVNYLDCDVEKLHVDFLSLSGHKIYGPKGIGVLYVRNNTPLTAVQIGGHQERNLRSGTLNVPGMVGLGAALELTSQNRTENIKHVSQVRDYLIEQLKTISNTVINTDIDVCLPSHAHVSFLGAEGEAVLMALDLDGGIAVSTGSACASGTLGASHVLLAMGIKQEDAHGAIRFSLGKHNTKADVDDLMKILPGIIKRFRDMSPIK
jgi:cysteine desulfurase